MRKSPKEIADYLSKELSIAVPIFITSD